MADEVDELVAMLAKYQAAMDAALQRAAPAVREQASVQAELFRSASADVIRLLQEQTEVNASAIAELQKRLTALQTPTPKAPPAEKPAPATDAVDAELEARLSADDFGHFAHRVYPVPPR